MIRLLQVSHSGVPVGRLAASDRGAILFQYDPAWLRRGFDLAPGSLPFDGVANPSPRPGEFSGLHGVFNDSLPDGWGQLLMDRALKQHQGLDRWQISPLDRLAYMGRRAMGALEYQPEILPDDVPAPFDLAGIAAEAEKVMQGESAEVLESLRVYGGSPGGARPKVTVALSADRRFCRSGFADIPADYAHWIVKFRGDADPIDTGRAEKAYADMATLSGLEMPPTALIDIEVGRKAESFFAVQRFDRRGNEKMHCLSLAGYAYADHRVPCLDYDTGVLAATKKLTRSDVEVQKAFRLMLFNVLAHNRDDHSKNFAYLRHPELGVWRLSPAFDLTFNHGLANQHTTSVSGSGSPTFADLKKVADRWRIPGWLNMLDQVRNALAQWSALAEQYGVAKARTREIQSALAEVDRACAPR